MACEDDSRKVRFLLFKVMYAYTLVLSCSSLTTSSIYRIFVEYWCTFSDRPISTQSDLRPSAGHLGWSYSVYKVPREKKTKKDEINLTRKGPTP